jgi:hypothetical protein
VKLDFAADDGDLGAVFTRNLKNTNKMRKLMDHELLFFNTNSSALIEEKDYAIKTIDNELYYTFLLNVQRNSKSYDAEIANEPVKLNIGMYDSFSYFHY